MNRKTEESGVDEEGKVCILVDHRVPPGNSVGIGDLSVENRTSNSIIVSYDKEKKRVLVVECCLEEQGK